MRVVAVILNYNSSEDCEKCISYLKKQDYDDLGIIVVDNASNKDDQEKIKKICDGANVEVIFNKENTGYAAGNNVGLKKAVEDGADWSLIINPDVELKEQNYISYMMEKISENSSLAMAASSVVLPDGRLQNPQKENSYLYETLWILKHKNKTKNANWNVVDQDTKFCEKVSGCCFFINSEFLKEIGYLDENTFLYCEESILGKQATKCNRKILYINDIKAFHNHTEKQDGDIFAKNKIHLKSRRYYLRKYSGYKFIKLWVALCANKLEELLFNIKRLHGTKSR